MKVADWFRGRRPGDGKKTERNVRWRDEMLNKSMITAAAVFALAAGATSLQSAPAEAGVTIQFVHGKSHNNWGNWGKKGYWGYGPRFHGPRYGFYGSDRPFCFTRYKTVKVRKWHPRKHRWVVRRIERPVRVCR